MFNLKKLVTAEQIHKEVHSWEDMIAEELQERKASYNGSKLDEELLGIGFSGEPSVKKVEESKKQIDARKDDLRTVALAQAIMGSTEYTIITPEGLRGILEKYNLYQGEIDSFKSKIPEKNKHEIVEFNKLHEQRLKELFSQEDNGEEIKELLAQNSKNVEIIQYYKQNTISYSFGDCREEKNIANYKSGYTIVATHDDFDTTGKAIKNRQIYVEDPIVFLAVGRRQRFSMSFMFPVSSASSWAEFYVLVSAWGPESQIKETNSGN